MLPEQRSACAFAQSGQKVHQAQFVIAYYAKFLHADAEGSGQTSHLRKPMCVFAGRTDGTFTHGVA